MIVRSWPDLTGFPGSRLLYNHLTFVFLINISFLVLPLIQKQEIREDNHSSLRLLERQHETLRQKLISARLWENNLSVEEAGSCNRSSSISCETQASNDEGIGNENDWLTLAIEPFRSAHLFTEPHASNQGRCQSTSTAPTWAIAVIAILATIIFALAVFAVFAGIIVFVFALAG